MTQLHDHGSTPMIEASLLRRAPAWQDEDDEDIRCVNIITSTHANIRFTFTIFFFFSIKCGYLCSSEIKKAAEER